MSLTRDLKMIYPLILPENILKLENWDCLIATGADCASFFQGQLTQNVMTLLEGHGHLTARLGPDGRILFFLYLFKLHDHYLLFTPNQKANDLKMSLDKFNIMGEVSLCSIENPYALSFQRKSKDDLHFFFGREKAFLTKSAHCSNQTIQETSFLLGVPQMGLNTARGQLLNETTLNDWGVDYQKGCFVGQETISKIQNNKKGATYPMLIHLKEVKLNNGPLFHHELKIGNINGALKKDSDFFYQVSIKRDFQDLESISLVTPSGDFKKTKLYSF